MSIKLIIGKNSELAKEAILIAEKNGVEVEYQKPIIDKTNSKK